MSCEKTGKKEIDITESEKINLILIEDLFNPKEIKNLITVNKIEYSKVQDFGDNCFVYNYSNEFFSEQNKFRGAITSDTYEYYSKEKKDIRRFFNDSLNRNHGFESFKFILTNDYKLNSDLYAVHEIFEDDKFTGYTIAVVLSDKIIRSTIVFLNPMVMKVDRINEKLNRIKTMPNNGYN